MTTETTNEDVKILARQLRNQCSVSPTRPLDELEEIFAIRIQGFLNKFAKDNALAGAQNLLESGLIRSDEFEQVCEDIERANRYEN